MTPDDVRAMIQLARESGLRRLKVDGLELEFADAAKARDPAQKPKGRPVPSPEDFLLWSTGEALSFEQPAKPPDPEPS